MPSFHNFENMPESLKEMEPVHEFVGEISPEEAFYAKRMQYNYVCSSESDKYHKPTCRWMRTWFTLIRSQKRKQQDMMLAEPVSQSKTMVLKSSGFLFVGNALLES